MIPLLNPKIFTPTAILQCQTPYFPSKIKVKISSVSSNNTEPKSPQRPPSQSTLTSPKFANTSSEKNYPSLLWTSIVAQNWTKKSGSRPLSGFPRFLIILNFWKRLWLWRSSASISTSRGTRKVWIVRSTSSWDSAVCL